MSVPVFGEVGDYSKARGMDRLVLLAIAEAAWRDGVCWLKIGENEDDPGTICSFARCSKREAIRAIKLLNEDLREIEVRKVRRGRSYVNVYRVVLRSVGLRDIEYERLPFTVEPAFLQGDELARWIAGKSAGVSTTGIGTTPLVQGDSLAPSRGSFKVTDPADSRCQPDAVQGDISDRFKVTPSRAREEDLEPEENHQQPEPPVEPSGDQDLKDRGELAAGEPPAPDREVIARVRALRGADVDSPKRILPLAQQLPASVFLGTVASVEAARASNPCGLLTHRLRVALAERHAVQQAAFMAGLGPAAKQRAAAPWGTESLKRDAPDRYVRLLAHELTDDDLGDVLAAYQPPERIAELLQLAGLVRAGDEPAAEPETPEQARERWVDDKALDTGFALEEIQAVVEGWDDVDDIEREGLLERADTTRAAALQRQAEAA